MRIARLCALPALCGAPASCKTAHPHTAAPEELARFDPPPPEVLGLARVRTP